MGLLMKVGIFLADKKVSRKLEFLHVPRSSYYCKSLEDLYRCYMDAPA